MHRDARRSRCARVKRKPTARYHPHIRQDYGQETGPWNVLVVPADPGYWMPAHRELMVTLDDVLIEDGRIAPFDPRQTTYSAMGRFGNRMLVNRDLLDLGLGDDHSVAVPSHAARVRRRRWRLLRVSVRLDRTPGHADGGVRRIRGLGGEE